MSRDRCNGGGGGGASHGSNGGSNGSGSGSDEQLPVFWFSLNVVCVAAAVSINKSVLADSVFAYPLYLTVFHITVSAACLHLVINVNKVARLQHPLSLSISSSSASDKPWLDDVQHWKCVFSYIAFLFASNQSQRYNSLTNFQIFRTLSVPCVAVLFPVDFLNKLSSMVAFFALSLLVDGALLSTSTFSLLSVDPISFSYGILSVISIILYSTQLNSTVRMSYLSLPELMATVCTRAILPSLGLALLFENTPKMILSFFRLSPFQFLLCYASALLCFACTFTFLCCLKHVRSFSSLMAGPYQTLCIFAVDALLLTNEPFSVLGLFLIVIGLYVYNILESQWALEDHPFLDYPSIDVVEEQEEQDQDQEQEQELQQRGRLFNLNCIEEEEADRAQDQEEEEREEEHEQEEQEQESDTEPYDSEGDVAF